jgi:ankyrin repeat protein
MYPNPQDVLPLPPRPSLEQYRKRAKDLVKAHKSGDSGALRAWATQWIEALARLYEWRESGKAITRYADQLEQFARDTLTRGAQLSSAQFVIARAHGFESWSTLAKHVEALASATSPVTSYEAAADAIVTGDADALAQLLRREPDLIRARSTREHQATLLHYLAANGVENYRQRTPANAVAIGTMLLDAGADVDAEADMYGGGATTLGLVATSVHPQRAGVQQALMELLLRRGARLDDGIVNACLANGQPDAATYLADRGARLDLTAAAGIGRLEVVKASFAAGREATKAQVNGAFALACGYGRAAVVEFLLEAGVDVDVRLHGFGRGHTGLHVAAYGAQVEVVRLLLQRGASVDVTDETWGTTPLVWALHAWSEEPKAPAGRYYDVVAVLVAAGASVRPDLLADPGIRSDERMLAALTRFDSGGEPRMAELPNDTN